MTITLSPKIKTRVLTLVKDYNYQDETEFIEDALRHWILKLKKEKRFLNMADRVRDRVGQNTDITQREFEESAKALKRAIIKKFHNKALPSLEEQLANI